MDGKFKVTDCKRLKTNWIEKKKHFLIKEIDAEKGSNPSFKMKKKRDLHRDKTWWGKKLKKRTLGSEMQTVNVKPVPINV